ncbi:glycosyltransferase [Arcticibacter tournemirensis]|uniref:Glycosyltransferase family 1 protein n=1 Tax=Arcticibacter tournemirensis TaxID=699437 RepID=A0A4Q0M9G7_9SPHI|nr:glycosyltransferase family 1 protein [Arcticibacter tournemirensis]
MTKILHIVHVLSRGGGLSNLIMNYYRNIDRTKVQFDFIYFEEVNSNFKEEITSLGGKYYKFTKPSLNLKYVKEAKTFFKAHNGEYTAVHCHALFAVAAYAFIAKKSGIKIIIAHAHSNSNGMGTLRKIRNAALNHVANCLATYKFACSVEAASFMFGKRAIKSNKARVISNAIDYQKYSFSEEIRAAVRVDLKIPEDMFVVGHVGALTYPKNHIYLIEIFKEIKKINPRSLLLLAGDDGLASGSTRPLIEAKVEEYHLKDSVRFLGVRNDLNLILMAEDVFVFPSNWEGFGLALIEAQASGLPSFASTNVPLEVKCTDLAMFLSLGKSPEDWAKEILSYRCDVNKRMIDSKKFSRFDIKEQAGKLQNLYLQMS